MYVNQDFDDFSSVLRSRPHAWAQVHGSCDYPEIQGCVYFYQTRCGVLVSANIAGLPHLQGCCGSPVFGFHIHEGSCCSGSAEDPFAAVGMHYNPYHCPHPYHAGDLPPLFYAGGIAFSTVLTNRFTLDEVIGRTIILHSSPDDFTTQPSGNSGTKIACGEIRKSAQPI